MEIKGNKMIINNQIREFLDECVSNARYSKVELNILKELLNNLPAELYMDFLKDLYMDRLALRKNNESLLQLRIVARYINNTFREHARIKAKEAIFNYKEGRDLQQEIKEIIQESLRINGEGEQYLMDLQKYFYNDLTKNVKTIIKDFEY